jgi:hypothetical protein
MDETAPDGARGTRVRALLWGKTGADREHAKYRATCVPSRRDWVFAEFDVREGVACPLDVADACALAGERGEHWAYAVYRIGERVAR